MREVLRIVTMVLGLIVAAAVTNGQTRYLDGLAFTGPFALPAADGELKPLIIPTPTREPEPAGVLISCMPNPRELSKSLPRGVIRWTCGVRNQDAASRRITESMLVYALLSQGVSAMPSADIALRTGEKVRVGFWNRSTRYLSQLAVPLALAAAGDVIDLTAAEGRLAAGVAFVLPRLTDLWAERAPKINVPTWAEQADLSPGNHLVLFLFSGPYGGPVPVEVTLP